MMLPQDKLQSLSLKRTLSHVKYLQVRQKTTLVEHFTVLLCKGWFLSSPRKYMTRLIMIGRDKYCRLFFVNVIDEKEMFCEIDTRRIVFKEINSSSLSSNISTENLKQEISSFFSFKTISYPLLLSMHCCCCCTVTTALLRKNKTSFWQVEHLSITQWPESGHCSAHYCALLLE